MIVLKRFKAHFETRAIEWGMAGWAVTWGLQVLLNPEVFTSPVTRPLNQHMLNTLETVFTYNQAFHVLGILAVFAGLVRGAALTINGFWKQTPLIRIGASAISAFVVSNVAFSLMQGPPTLGVVTYSWLFAADCLSGFRAARDHKTLKKG